MVLKTGIFLYAEYSEPQTSCPSNLNSKKKKNNNATAYYLLLNILCVQELGIDLLPITVTCLQRG